jgi:hypothetical protein
VIFFSIFRFEIHIRRRDFFHHAKLAKALMAITQDELIKFATSLSSSKQKRIYSFAVPSCHPMMIIEGHGDSQLTAVDSTTTVSNTGNIHDEFNHHDEFVSADDLAKKLSNATSYVIPASDVPLSSSRKSFSAWLKTFDKFH